MASIFHRDKDGQWQVITLPLAGAVLRLDPIGLDPCSELPADLRDGCLLSHVRESGQWVVLAAPGSPLALNGISVSTGLRVLRHRDALRLGSSAPAYFSTEETARIERYERTGEPLYCPRCRSEILHGQQVVRCPACGVVHHEEPDGRNCWSYADTCAVCSQPTATDAGYQWTPEEL